MGTQLNGPGDSLAAGAVFQPRRAAPSRSSFTDKPASRNVRQRHIVLNGEGVHGVAGLIRWGLRLTLSVQTRSRKSAARNYNVLSVTSRQPVLSSGISWTRTRSVLMTSPPSGVMMGCAQTCEDHARQSGLRGVLIGCSGDGCGHSVEIGGHRWPATSGSCASVDLRRLWRAWCRHRIGLLRAQEVSRSLIGTIQIRQSWTAASGPHNGFRSFEVVMAIPTRRKEKPRWSQIRRSMRSSLRNRSKVSIQLLAPNPYPPLKPMPMLLSLPPTRLPLRPRRTQAHRRRLTLLQPKPSRQARTIPARQPRNHRKSRLPEDVALACERRDHPSSLSNVVDL